MCRWLHDELGADVPFHLSAFHPDFQMRDRGRTPAATLKEARKIALDQGLRYVYLGNVLDAEGQTTFCPQCQSPLIERGWHDVRGASLKEGCCPQCQTPIAGVFA